MADSAVQKIAKPVLRNHLFKKTRFHIIAALAFGISWGMAYKVFIQDPRKKKYAEFYRTYDAQADYERMLAAGVFTPITPSDDE